MHLQQTKVKGRQFGGPQYYFHDVDAPVKDFLRRRAACPVVLQTPYGIAASPFMAVDRDHKLAADGKPIPGKVGHDRIQQASGTESIGEAIRHWYGLQGGRDFERIDIDVTIHKKGHFIVVPTAVRLRDAARKRVLEKVVSPLSFHHDHQSKLWRQQIEHRKSQDPTDVSWAAAQMSKIVADHAAGSHILEADLIRAAGALSLLGLDLGPYLGAGYDCQVSTVQFRSLPLYPCPVEVKKRSRGFTYQVTRYPNLPRVIVLCMEHDYVNPPDDVDFIELPALAKYLTVR
jgi:hypothetical protein